jgi:hypothetical protein
VLEAVLPWARNHTAWRAIDTHSYNLEWSLAGAGGYCAEKLSSRLRLYLIVTQILLHHH